MACMQPAAVLQEREGSDIIIFMKRVLSYLIAFCCVAVLASGSANAQNWKSVLSGLAKSAGEKVSEKVSEKVAEKVDLVVLEGDWSYLKPDCRFESDNFLSKAGGEVAAAKVEEHMSNVLQKIGIDENAQFTFTADSTYTLMIGKRNLGGTYSYNKETKEIVMTSRLKKSFTAKVLTNVLHKDKMSLLFDADKLMDFVKNITENIASKSSNKSILAVNNLLSKFDGLMLGIELQRPQTGKPAGISAAEADIVE